MERPDETSARFEEKRVVTFAADTRIIARAPKPFAPMHQATNASAAHRHMKTMVFKCLFNGEFDKLKSFFESYEPQDRANFYTTNGTAIFRMAILSSKTEPFEHLIDTVSHEVTCELLTRDGFSILDGFIGGQRIEEDDDGGASIKSKAVFAEKLTMIFQLGDEQINNYIENNASYKYMAGRGLRFTH